MEITASTERLLPLAFERQEIAAVLVHQPEHASRVAVSGAAVMIAIEDV
jgi:hypothetical protein